jgi:hypothetical protein
MDRSVPVAASAGSTGTVANVAPFRSGYISGLAVDPNGNPYLYLAPEAVLSVSVVTAVTAAKNITILAQGGDF